MKRKFRIAIPELPIERSLLPEHIFEECELLEGNKAIRGDNTQLMESISDVDAIIFNSSNVIDEELMKQAAKLKIVFKSGARPENVDYSYAKAHGIAVGWTPRANVQSVAEYTILLMLSGLRQFVEATAIFAAGGWRNQCGLGYDLSNRTVGLVGFGGIGQQVAKMLKGFGAEVIAYDPYMSKEVFDQSNVERVGFSNLLTRSDIISIHCMLTKETKDLFNQEAFNQMKKGALLVNTARGGILNEAALMEALDAQKIAGAALDVYAQEPPAVNHPFRKTDRIITTPHIAARTQEASYRECVWAIEGALDYMNGRKLQNVVVIAPENN